MTLAYLGVIRFTPGLLCLLPSGVLIRSEPFLAKTGLGVKQNLPPFFLSIIYAVGPKIRLRCLHVT